MNRNTGAMSGDRRLEAEGRSEEVRGSLKQAGHAHGRARRAHQMLAAGPLSTTAARMFLRLC